ncbi:MAG TPA: SRPBCC family protein [Solirubrobacteraceae bacterium]|nr:SRPBCC family protein [Solirubrobacteraceae bacterium]
MREINGTATAVVPASRETVLELLGAVERYPQWHPDVVRSVEVLESDPDGRPLTVRTKLHVSTGPFTHDFNLTMGVRVDARGTVKLSKVKSDGSDQEFDVVWRLRKDKGTRIELDLAASLDVSRFLPLGGVGDSLAEGFVAAAAEALA